MEIIYHPIGAIHNPINDLSEMPTQPAGDPSVPGTAEVFPEFSEGLKDLDGFSHVILIYHLHKVSKTDLTVTPFLDLEPHGVFATRAPTRPNPMGVSISRLLNIEDNLLRFANLDLLDGTPLLDITPYVPDFDTPEGARIGWLEGARDKVRSVKADERLK
jgi:tRNA-Thr(GGU) m(6)t(6)A37 methyltransferase TsaA